MAATGMFDIDSFRKQTEDKVMQAYIDKYGQVEMAALAARARQTNYTSGFKSGDGLPTGVTLHPDNKLIYVILFGVHPAALYEIFNSAVEELQRGPGGVHWQKDVHVMEPAGEVNKVAAMFYRNDKYDNVDKAVRAMNDSTEQISQNAIADAVSNLPTCRVS